MWRPARAGACARRQDDNSDGDTDNSRGRRRRAGGVDTSGERAGAGNACVGGGHDECERIWRLGLVTAPARQGGLCAPRRNSGSSSSLAHVRECAYESAARTCMRTLAECTMLLYNMML